MTYIQTDMTHEETRLRARIAELESALRLTLAVSPDDPLVLTPAEQQVVGLREAAWNLLDAISEANSARGLDDKQCARWQVDEMSQALRKALAQVEP